MGMKTVRKKINKDFLYQIFQHFKLKRAIAHYIPLISRPVAISAPSWADYNNLLPVPLPGPGSDLTTDSLLPGPHEVAHSRHGDRHDRHLLGVARRRPAPPCQHSTMLLVDLH